MFRKNPETSAAAQILYSAADTADASARAILFRTIQHLTGQSVTVIQSLWKATR